MHIGQVTFSSLLDVGGLWEILDTEVGCELDGCDLDGGGSPFDLALVVINIFIFGRSSVIVYQ